MHSMSRVVAAVAVMGLLAAASPAAAQQLDWQAAPNFGSVQLTSGFQPDPHEIQLAAGGTIDSRVALGNACPGFVSSAPDFDLYWTAGSGALPLAISVNSAVDTTLVVRTPSGEWLCEDDGGFNALNPGLRIDNPQSGLYDIWVGTYSNMGGNYPPAVLSISELSSY